MNSILCPQCNARSINRNGLTRHGCQRYKCKECNHQFSEERNDRVVSLEDRNKIDKLLLERLSLRGICRVMNVSLPWLLKYIKKRYAQVPKHLNIITTGIRKEDMADDTFHTIVEEWLEKKRK